MRQILAAGVSRASRLDLRAAARPPGPACRGSAVRRACVPLLERPGLRVIASWPSGSRRQAAIQLAEWQVISAASCHCRFIRLETRRAHACGAAILCRCFAQQQRMIGLRANESAAAAHALPIRAPQATRLRRRRGAGPSRRRSGRPSTCRPASALGDSDRHGALL
jgi:hypothetical protein